jgi:hypothetical protein
MGTCTVVPIEGTALNTVFTFTATNWEGNELPFKYEYSFLSVNGNFLTVLSWSDLRDVESALPAGRPVSQYALDTRVRVSNALSARTAKIQVVTVWPSVDLATTSDHSSNSNTSLLYSTLADAILSEDGSVAYAYEMKGLIVSIIDTAISANCSAVSDVFCAGLKRADCSVVVGTCGHCLDGNFGEYGHKNCPCISDTADSSSAAAAQFLMQESMRVRMSQTPDTLHKHGNEARATREWA